MHKLESIPKEGRLVVLTGAGMSAESGLKTFRDNDGLWENHSVYEVATPEAWQRNPALVLEFYNQRRKQLLEVQPNQAHVDLMRLEAQYDVQIITQNVDDLHERAGSTEVMHLHGELRKSRSSIDEGLVYEIEGWELNLGMRCELGSQLRPHVVWFGEMVPMIEPAAQLVQQADWILVIGTSLNVYPAAGLLHSTQPGAPVIAIDPGEPELASFSSITHIKEKATVGLHQLMETLL